MLDFNIKLNSHSVRFMDYSGVLWSKMENKIIRKRLISPDIIDLYLVSYKA